MASKAYNPGQNVCHLHMICAFSNHPPPPQTVLGVTGQKRLRSLIKSMNFNFVQGGGGGGGGRGKPRHNRIDNC